MKNKTLLAFLGLVFIAIFLSNVQAQEVSYELLWSYKNGGLVAVSADGSYIAMSRDRNVYFFNREGKLLWSYKTVGGDVFDVSISSDGSYIVAGSGDGNVYFFNREGKLLWRYVTGLAVRDVSISSDGSGIAVESFMSVYFLDREGQLLWRYDTSEVYAGEVIAISVSSDGNYVAAWSMGRWTDNIVSGVNVYFFNREGKLLWTYIIEVGSFGASFSADGSYIAMSDGRNVYFFNREGKLLWSYKTVGGDVFDVSISSDGSYIVAGSQDKKIYFFNREGKLIWSYVTGASVSGVLISSDGSYIVAGSGDGNVYFFNREGKLLWSTKVGSGVSAISASSDGSYIAAGSGDKVYFFARKISAQPTAPALKTPAPTTKPPNVSALATPYAIMPATKPSQTFPPTKFKISRTVVYGIGGLAAVILIGALFLSVRKRRADERVLKLKKLEKKLKELKIRPSNAIVVLGLSKRYTSTTILDNISFQLAQGTLCAVVGTSGGGKSTIIESIIGRITPDAGEIEILGKNVKTQKEDLNKLVGFVPQHPELYLDQTVWQNMMNSALKWSLKDAEAKSEKILKQLDIYGRKDIIAKNLSGGQLKRLSLGMELIREPPILVLDEPTTGLDPTSRDQILTALSKVVSSEKRTAVFTTHFMDEAEHCDEVMIVGNAQILAKGPPSELARKMSGEGKIVSITLEEVSEDLVSRISDLEGVRKVIREGRTLKLIMDFPDLVTVSQKVKEFGGVVEEAKIAKAGMKEVFVYYTGVYPEDVK